MESQGLLGTRVAQAAIVLFLLVLLLVVVRTLVLYAVLFLMPASRVLRRFPGIRKALELVERRLTDSETRVE